MLNTLLSVVVPVFFFGLVGASMWYVDVRLRRVFGGTGRALSRWAAAAAMVAVVGLTGITATSASAALGWLYLVGGYIFTFHLFLVLTLLTWQVTGLKWRKRWQGALALAIPAFATLWGGVQANDFIVREQVVQLSGLKQPLTIVQISDVHLGHHRGRNYLQRIVEATNQHEPDLVVITGDLVDAHVALRSDVLAPLSGLAGPSFFVGGNHENYTDPELAFKLVAEQGVRVLRNERVELEGLQLIGLEYMNADDDAVDLHPSADKNTIKSVLPALVPPGGQPSVLLHHSPVGVAYAEAAGIDLLLSGHTHGGQFFPSTTLASLFFPFNEGLYAAGRTQVFVTPGAGTFLQRIRLGSRNEIAVLRLVPPPARLL